MVKVHGHIDYECEFCHELFTNVDAAECHEKTCDCRPENIHILKKKFEDKWFEMPLCESAGDDCVWVHIHCLDIFMDDDSPAVKFREIRSTPSGYMTSDIYTEDLNDFIYIRLTGFHEVGWEDVRKHILDVAEGWFN